MSQLTVTHDSTPDALVLRFAGHAGVGELQTVEVALMKASAARPALTVLDLADLQSISSITMGAIISYHRGVKRHGGRVHLATVQPMVRGALEHAGLPAILPMFGSVDEAIAGGPAAAV